MKRNRLWTWLCLAALIVAPATADEIPLIPVIPAQEFGPTAATDVLVTTPVAGTIVEGPIVHLDSAPVELFECVKYVDKHEQHPCAVTKVIKVNNPCACKKACCECCEKCVYIEICVPPCDCDEVVKCRRHGDRVRYDYGKYAVDVRVRKGFIVVDYQR